MRHGFTEPLPPLPASAIGRAERGEPPRRPLPRSARSDDEDRHLSLLPPGTDMRSPSPFTLFMARRRAATLLRRRRSPAALPLDREDERETGLPPMELSIDVAAPDSAAIAAVVPYSVVVTRTIAKVPWLIVGCYGEDGNREARMKPLPPLPASALGREERGEPPRRPLPRSARSDDEDRHLSLLPPGTDMRSPSPFTLFMARRRGDRKGKPPKPLPTILPSTRETKVACFPVARVANRDVQLPPFYAVDDRLPHSNWIMKTKEKHGCRRWSSPLTSQHRTRRLSLL
nr:hypothetical protein Iba_chr04bCG15770 [Ipomoea batatas]